MFVNSIKEIAKKGRSCFFLLFFKLRRNQVLNKISMESDVHCIIFEKINYLNAHYT